MKNLGGAYFELGRLYLALHLRDQNDARKHLTPAGVTFGIDEARRRLVQAKVAFGQSRRLHGEQEPWHDAYAEAVTRLADSEYAGCVAACDRILGEEPDLEEVWKLRGDAQRLMGEDPASSYGRAVDVRRSYFEAYHALGEALLERGQVPEARAALDRAIEIHGDFVPSRAPAGRQRAARGHPQRRAFGTRDRSGGAYPRARPHQL